MTSRDIESAAAAYLRTDPSHPGAQLGASDAIMEQVLEERAAREHDRLSLAHRIVTVTPESGPWLLALAAVRALPMRKGVPIAPRGWNRRGMAF